MRPDQNGAVVRTMSIDRRGQPIHHPGSDHDGQTTDLQFIVTGPPAATRSTASAMRPLWKLLGLVIVSAGLLALLIFALRELEERAMQAQPPASISPSGSKLMEASLERRLPTNDSIRFIGLSLLWVLLGAVQASAALWGTIILLRFAKHYIREPAAEGLAAPQDPLRKWGLLLGAIACTLALAPYALALFNDGRVSSRELAVIWQQGALALIVGGVLWLAIRTATRRQARTLNDADRLAVAAVARVYADTNRSAGLYLAISLKPSHPELETKAAYVQLDPQGGALVESLLGDRGTGRSGLIPTALTVRESACPQLEDAEVEETYEAMVTLVDASDAATLNKLAKHGFQQTREGPSAIDYGARYQLAVRRRGHHRFVEVTPVAQPAVAV